MLTPEEVLLYSSFGGRADGRREGSPSHFVPTHKASHQRIPQHLPQHLQQLSYHIAATSLSTSLQKGVPPSVKYFVPTPKASHHSIPQHLQQPSYYLAATSLSTTLQKLWKSPKITKNTKKTSNFPYIVNRFWHFFLRISFGTKKEHDYTARKKKSIKELVAHSPRFETAKNAKKHVFSHFL